MEIQGSAFLSRQVFIVSNFGEERWQKFLADYAQRDPTFQRPITAVSRIPVEPFLAFCDALIDTFFGGDRNAYWLMGEKAAEWALTEGPYRALLTAGDLKQFCESALPSLRRAYLADAGTLSSVYRPGSFEILIKDLPVQHPYFEFAIAGYALKALELFAQTHRQQVLMTCLAGSSKGDAEARYRFDFSGSS